MIPRDALDGRRLHLVIMPTEACQFRCTYCYEDFALGRMPPGVVTALKTWIEKRAPDLDLLQLSWFGGEPLLAFDLVEDLQGHALDLARRHPAMAVTANMTTNGERLAFETFTRLLALGISRFQITLDGPAQIHDRTRLRAGGGGTFVRIWDNLLAMRAAEPDFSILLRLHVHRDNAEHVPELLHDCAAALGGDRRFRVAFKALFHPGHADFDGRVLYGPGQADATLARLSSMAAELGLADPSGDSEGANDEDSICYAAKANSFVVRSDGTLGKCSVALSAPENRVGRLELDGTVSIDGERVEPWLRGLFSGEDEARRCPLKGIRAGAVAPA